MGRPYFRFVAVLFFIAGILAAILWPNGVRPYGWTIYAPIHAPVTGFIPPPPPGAIDHRIGLRIAIAVGGALIAAVLALMGRRRRMREQPGHAPA